MIHLSLTGWATAEQRRLCTAPIQPARTDYTVRRRDA